jgi:lipoprotein NlpD
MTGFWNVGRLTLSALVLAVAAGCASNKTPNNAPVEDRSSGTGRAPVVSAEPVAVPAIKQPPGFENAGKPGYYTVKQGDTLIRIGLETGQNWRDVARWNGLENPNLIEIGQVLRVVPPTADNPVVVARPVASPSAAASSVTPTQSASAARPAAAATSPASAAAAAASAASEEELGWIWPTSAGAVLAGFDEAKNKGLDIGGKVGDAVLAAADGRVVYSGAGLRGYGNLIILKHNNTYLSAYAHNQTLLVKEDQSVRKGQKIAEMGNSDSDKVKLHFEIRRQGKPVDPSRYLPAR